MNQASFEEKMAHVEWLAEQDRYAKMTLPDRGKCEVDDRTAIMDREYFNALLDYSHSLPTGTFIDKRWKCKVSTHKGCKTKEHEEGPSYNRQRYRICVGHVKQEVEWRMGEYYELPEGQNRDRRGELEVGIRWRNIVIL